MYSGDWRYSFRCPCGTSIPLPRQSLLGIFARQQRQPTDEWPIDFLCLACGRLFSQSDKQLLPGGPYLHETQLPKTCLWKIDFLCDQDNCESLQRIYVLYLESAQPKEAIGTSIEFLTSATCALAQEIPLHTEMVTDEKLPG